MANCYIQGEFCVGNSPPGWSVPLQPQSWVGTNTTTYSYKGSSLLVAHALVLSALFIDDCCVPAWELSQYKHSYIQAEFSACSSSSDCSVPAPELSQYKHRYKQGESSMSNSSTGCSVPAPELSQYRYKFRYMESPLCTLLIDSGYSFTHVVPYCKGKKLRDAVCRSV